MKRKKCFKCGEIKLINQFYVHPKMGDGHLGKCKECTKKDVKIRTIVFNDKVRAYDKKRYKGKRKNDARRRAIIWKTENPEKYRAHYLLGNAVRDKRIIRPNYCEVCGKECIPHGHHTDYSQPLFVVWLCAQCHGQIQ